MNTDIPGSAGIPSIGWYVHLPFCATKCGYCDFYSLPTIPALIDSLVEAIEAEIALRNPNKPAQTIFIGGGTPTVLPAEALGRILRTVTAAVGPVQEFTVEANPSSADELKLSILRENGVNRISFGAQSFHPEELAILERIHDPVHISESVALARAAGFTNLNLDFIFGIPGQTEARWRETLCRAIDLGPEHLSCYSLMYETGTALTRQRNERKIIPCDEELEADLHELTVDVLAAAGYEQYEISNFAKPGCRCQANMIYWENREYLGIGPSAVSFLDGVRRKNIADVRRYIDCARSRPADLAVETESLPPEQFAAETAVQMLRLVDGIDTALFQEQTGFDAHELFAPQIERFSEMGLLIATPTRIRLTRKGLLLSNRVMEEFLPDQPQSLLPILPA